MKKLILFFTLVFVFATGLALPLVGHAQAGRQCFDLFAHAELKPFTELRSRLQPWELKQTGTLIRTGTSELTEVLASIESRDGTYPLLIDKAGNVIMAHRLPNNQPGVNTPYLATHRGLYLSLKEQTGGDPQIIFAGQIRVIAGKTVSLIDQAGTFYDLATEMTGDSSVIPLQQQLIASNQRRLDYAFALLKQLGIATEQTVLLNFRKRVGPYEDRPGDGHVSAQKAALFEIKCRKSAACWEKFLRVDAYLRKVDALGGNRYLADNVVEWMRVSGVGVYNFYQILSMITVEGTLDVMAMDQMLEPNTSRGQMFQEFYDQLIPILGQLP